ncbi:hypothetical protein [Mycobacterium dioxanotrophicus]|uniref:hypothetical protein n=1 Tax=Mycobacterium dioxanotrophicus TaxID=482462 RepID=UPI001E4DCFCA|nr:hypothetical protein [Mycobacterium dioxanotrophicus]
MLKKLVLLPILLCVAALTTPTWAAADPVSAVPDGPAIAASAVADVTKQLGKPAKLNVSTLNESQGWAFVWAKITDPSGRPISYDNTPFADAAAEGGKSKSYAGLFHSDGGAWKLATSSVGPTDVAWTSWSSEYSAPASIFNLSGS